MIRAALVALAVMTPAFAIAQSSITIETIPLPSEDSGLGLGPPLEEKIITRTGGRGEIAAGAVLRALDKVSGETTDVELTSGQTAQIFALDVGLNECRFPAGNPAGDAFAYLTITQPSDADPLFAGWMIASSPALSALDHARYDVWVLRCITS